MADCAGGTHRTFGTGQRRWPAAWPRLLSSERKRVAAGVRAKSEAQGKEAGARGKGEFIWRGAPVFPNVIPEQMWSLYQGRAQDYFHHIKMSYIVILR